MVTSNLRPRHAKQLLSSILSGLLVVAGVGGMYVLGYYNGYKDHYQPPSAPDPFIELCVASGGAYQKDAWNNTVCHYDDPSKNPWRVTS